VTPFDINLGYSATVVVLLALASFPLRAFLSSSSSSSGDDEKKKKEEEIPQIQLKKVPGATISGALFGAGLAISGMVLPSKLYGFLNISGITDGSWDPTLACVMGGGVIISWLSYQHVPGFGRLFGRSSSSSDENTKQFSQPINAPTFCVPTNCALDWKLLVGEALFGIGWALGLLCPGPALYHVAVGDPSVVFHWMPAFLVGSQIGNWIKTLS
jgi:uncharacterized protein